MNTNPESSLKTGVVCRRNFSSYLVATGGQILSCPAPLPKKEFSAAQGKRHPRRQRVAADGSIAPFPYALVAGDCVLVRMEGQDRGSILRAYPRRNRISRKPTGARRGNAEEQILAANVDQVIAFCAVDCDRPEWHMLDRFLALAEAADLPAVVLLSKSDLLPSDASAQGHIRGEANEYRRIGYPVVECSGKTRSGIEEGEQILFRKTSILLGKSGVGKTTLLNALFPGWNLRTGEINRFGEGRCTTSNAELFPLENGGAVVDTPGVRALNFWGMEGQNPAHVFREMRPLEGRCRFGLDCRHMEEPGCALRKAVEAGRISPRRFRSMLHLAEECNE
jgi:ribosome biogenesis GTPase